MTYLYTNVQHMVLDRGYVAVVDKMGDDQSIVRSARVSYAHDHAFPNKEKDEKLIKYLWKNGHTSPFESVAITLEVKAPIFVARQWMRHRTWSFNEVSARYTEVESEYYLPKFEHFGTQHTSNKQMRTLGINDNAVSWFCQMREQNNLAVALYESFIRQGMPRELARTVLPQSMYTRFYGTVNLANLFRFLKLRNHEHAQFEIQEYAKVIDDLISTMFPLAHKAFTQGDSHE